ncbi:MAG: DUF4190 domain-containing protein [Phycisphaera sp.]|nr:DUF4190 domain-containing protein [Phycisphaera sp.]
MTDPPPASTSAPSSSPPPVATSDDAPADGLGLTGLLLSILGVATCGLWLFSIPGLIVSIIATQRGRSAKAKAGVVLGAIGIVEFLMVVPLLLGLLLPTLAKARDSARQVKEANQLAQIHKAFKVFAETERLGGSMPLPGRINRASHPELPHHEDSWGNAYRIEPGPGGAQDPVVSSDGPDQTPGTEDDLRHPPE